MVLSTLYNLSTGTAKFVWSYVGPTTPKKITKRTQIVKAKQGKKQKGYLYAFETHRNTYKVGKTINMDQRMRSYRTVYPDGVVFFQVCCENIHHSERILHDLLKMGSYHVKQEIFQINGALLKEYMKIVCSLDQTLKNGDTEAKMRKIADFINKLN